MYKTCEVCGSNLDPNERCDCEIKLSKKNESLFTIGRNVRVLFAEDTYEPTVGSIGTIAAIEEDLIGVEFNDPNFLGHSCNGSVTTGRGYWFFASDLLAI